MQISRTAIENGFVELVLSDGKEDGESIAVRIRAEPKTSEFVIGLQLATLRQVRDAVGAEIQRLSHLADQIQ